MKQPYTKPTVFRVKLNYQEAVLAGCSTSFSNASGSGLYYCRANGCRNTGATRNRDSASGS
jgi:hypothetical protein